MNLIGELSGVFPEAGCREVVHIPPPPAPNELRPAPRLLGMSACGPLFSALQPLASISAPIRAA